MVYNNKNNKMHLRGSLMKNVALTVIESAMLPSWGYDYNPGDFNVSSKLNYMHTPIGTS
jgi:hypothetical protein